jgi:hypothetical protein
MVSIMFDEGLKVKLLTVGYPCDFDAPNTNSNKFGAVVGECANSMVLQMFMLIEVLERRCKCT